MRVQLLRQINRWTPFWHHLPEINLPSNASRNAPALLLLLSACRHRCGIHLVKRDLQRLERDGLEVVNINAARQKLRFGVLRNEPRDKIRSDRELLFGPVEEGWELTAIRHASLAGSKLVEERMAECLDGGETSAGGVLKQSRN